MKLTKKYFIIGILLFVSFKTLAADTLFDKNSKASMKQAGCVYDLKSTYVSSFKRPGYCSGIALKICFASVKCPNLDKSDGLNFKCVAPNGKCPKDPADCRFGENAITNDMYGPEIIESDKDQPKSKSLFKTRFQTTPDNGGAGGFSN